MPGLTFDGLSIPGIVEPWAPAAWDVLQQIHTQFSVYGGGVLFGGRTTRTLSVPLWLFDSASPYASFSALMSQIAAIEAKIGRIASLVEDSGADGTYPLCYLERVTRREPPLAPNTHLGWSQKLTLDFRQMEP